MARLGLYGSKLWVTDPVDQGFFGLSYRFLNHASYVDGYVVGFVVEFFKYQDGTDLIGFSPGYSFWLGNSATCTFCVAAP